MEQSKEIKRLNTSHTVPSAAAPATAKLAFLDENINIH
jgi:hypothetical protein